MEFYGQMQTEARSKFRDFGKANRNGLGSVLPKPFCYTARKEKFYPTHLVENAIFVKNKNMVIEIPDRILQETERYSQPEAIKIDFAAWLYEREMLTLAQAARMCEQTRLKFQKTLKTRGIYLNYDSHDLAIDVQNM